MMILRHVISEPDEESVFEDVVVKGAEELGDEEGEEAAGGEE